MYYSGAANLTLEKGERVTTGGERRGEIRGETGDVSGVSNAPTANSLGKR